MQIKVNAKPAYQNFDKRSSEVLDISLFQLTQTSFQCYLLFIAVFNRS